MKHELQNNAPLRTIAIPKPLLQPPPFWYGLKADFALFCLRFFKMASAQHGRRYGHSPAARFQATHWPKRALAGMRCCHWPLSPFISNFLRLARLPPPPFASSGLSPATPALRRTLRRLLLPPSLLSFRDRIASKSLFSVVFLDVCQGCASFFLFLCIFVLVRTLLVNFSTVLYCIIRETWLLRRRALCLDVLDGDRNGRRSSLEIANAPSIWKKA